MAFDEEIKEELEEEAAEAEETAEEAAEDTEKEENANNAAEENTQSEEEKLKAELADSKDKYLRLMAEYDNFRKRSAKERLDISASVKADTLSDILPVLDNFERAMGTETQDEA